MVVDSTGPLDMNLCQCPSLGEDQMPATLRTDVNSVLPFPAISPNNLVALHFTLWDIGRQTSGPEAESNSKGSTTHHHVATAPRLLLQDLQCQELKRTSQRAVVLGDIDEYTVKAVSTGSSNARDATLPSKLPRLATCH